MKLCAATVTVFLFSGMFLISTVLYAEGKQGNPKEQNIPAQTITSSLEMEITARVNGKYLQLGSTPGTIHIPECEERLFVLSGLKPSNITEYRKELQRLNIRRVKLPYDITDAELKTYSEQGLLDNLVLIDLGFCDELTSCSPLGNLQNIKSLELGSCDNLKDIAALSRLKNLESLDLSFCDKVEDLSPIASLTQLKSLSVYVADTKNANLSFLAKLESLKELSLFKNTTLDIKTLASLKNLTTLSLDSDPSMDFSPLVGLPKLKSLALYFGDEIGDLSPLAEMKELV